MSCPQFILFVVILVSLISNAVHSLYCGSKSGKEFVKFPNYNLIMTMDEFNDHVLNRDLQQLYYAMPNPPPYVPDRSYSSRVIQIDGPDEYMIRGGGVLSGDNPSCSSYNTSLIIGPYAGRAFFQHKDLSPVTTYVSGCPESYIIVLKCDTYDLTTKKCPIDSTFISVYLRTNIDDVPISDIAQELCKTTGVRFGAQDLKWFFTYGDQC